MYLTKTDFQEYLQCSKCLWLKKNNPDLYIRPSISEFDQKLIDEGYEVELAAREMFENGILVEGRNEQAALKTKELIQSKTSPIFQATFITSSGLLAKTDILIYNEFMNAWSIYEVKSSTSIKTGKDENHIYDITFQKLVLNQSDIPVDETYVSAIPKVEGFSPHQHIPFQVSVHILQFDRQLKHYEYLADNIENAPLELIEFLRDTVPSMGYLISWHASFENTRNKQIAEIYPEYSQFLLDLNERTFDLETIFKDDYRHPGFKGRTSIKKVLPVLCPEFAYKDLNIQNGTEAMENWNRTIFDEELEELERVQIQKSLLEYCKLDTLAMVKIFKHLLDI